MPAFDLNPKILQAAYSQGYFPMPDSETGEILWFRPDPRAIIPLDSMHVSKSLRKVIRKGIFKVSFDTAFEEVMLGCADRSDTWITSDFIRIYSQMFELGKAHSVEIWYQDKLAGGTYGVSLGGAFFAESMFHKVSNASKVAIYALVEHLKQQGFELLECQFLTSHLKSLGAIEITDQEYLSHLGKALKAKPQF